jgi:hypothetical protein
MRPYADEWPGAFAEVGSVELTPILVASSGRSGTTALMALLNTDSCAAFDRNYPLENRYLTHLAKFATLAGQYGGGPDFDQTPLCNYDYAQVGQLPWPLVRPPRARPPLALATADWLAALWAAFAAGVRQRHPGATHYVEKAPAWLAPAVRGVLPCRTVYLVRDPRDVFLSVNAFNHARGYLCFSRAPGDSDLDYARTLAANLLELFENQREDSLRTDSFTLRYEELVTNAEVTASRLNDSLGVRVTPSLARAASCVPWHLTSPTTESSVARWRREPLPGDAATFLERHLDEAMTFNAYPRAAYPGPPTTVDLTRAARGSPDGDLVPTADGWAVTVRGADFWVAAEPNEFPATAVREVWLCVRAGTGDHCSVYWRGPGQPFAEERSVHVACRPGLHWRVLRFPVARHALWRGTIARLRFDLFNGDTTSGVGGHVRWVRLVE